jgi:hypothetical protein
VSHMLSEWSKSLDVEHNVYVPAGWSKIAEALEKCGVTPVPGNAYSKPKKQPVPSTPLWTDALRRAPIVSAPPRPPAEAPPATRPSQEPTMATVDTPTPKGRTAEVGAPTSTPSPPASLSDLLTELKRAMRDEGVQHVAATLMRDGTLAVELRKVVVTTESLEV